MNAVSIGTIYKLLHSSDKCVWVLVNHHSPFLSYIYPNIYSSMFGKQKRYVCVFSKFWFTNPLQWLIPYPKDVWMAQAQPLPLQPRHQWHLDVLRLPASPKGRSWVLGSLFETPPCARSRARHDTKSALPLSLQRYLMICRIHKNV